VRFTEILQVDWYAWRLRRRRAGFLPRPARVFLDRRDAIRGRAGRLRGLRHIPPASTGVPPSTRSASRGSRRGRLGQRVLVRRRLLDLVTASGGVITRPAALAHVSDDVLERAVRSRALVRIFPNVYALAELAQDVRVLRAGALLHRPRTAISHTDALDDWGLLPMGPINPAAPINPAGPIAPVHVTGPGDEQATRWPSLRVHRRHGFVAAAPAVLVRAGLRVVKLEQAVVDSWPMLAKVDRRVPTIVALRERRTTGERLLATLDASPRAAGVAEMRHVFALVAAGCHSPLELWGHENVFSHPSMPPSRCQVPVRLASGLVYLDRLYDAEMVNVELDGAAYHGAPGQRERDLRRDAALAALGFVTVRFSHPRLFGDPDGARRQTLQILETRRRQLGVRSA
jgi:hypothetical protein